MLESVTRAIGPIGEIRNISKTLGALKAFRGLPFNVPTREIPRDLPSHGRNSCALRPRVDAKRRRLLHFRWNA